MSGTKRTWMLVKLDGNFGNQQLNLRKNSKTRVGVHNVALCGCFKISFRAPFQMPKENVMKSFSILEEIVKNNSTNLTKGDVNMITLIFFKDWTSL